MERDVIFINREIILVYLFLSAKITSAEPYTPSTFATNNEIKTDTCLMDFHQSWQVDEMKRLYVNHSV